MPSLCPICQQHFDHWADYHEHINIARCAEPAPAPRQVAPKATGPIEKREWTGPMDKAAKRRLVANGEARVGRQFFLGRGEL